MRKSNQFGPGDEEQQQAQMLFDGIGEEDRYMEMVKAGLDSHEINQNTLSIAINVLEKSFWWKFRSEKSKIRLITEMYNNLNELI